MHTYMHTSCLLDCVRIKKYEYSLRYTYVFVSAPIVSHHGTVGHVHVTSWLFAGLLSPKCHLSFLASYWSIPNHHLLMADTRAEELSRICLPGAQQNKFNCRWSRLPLHSGCFCSVPNYDKWDFGGSRVIWSTIVCFVVVVGAFVLSCFPL